MTQVLQDEWSRQEATAQVPPSGPVYWAPQPEPAPPVPAPRLGILNIAAVVTAGAGLVLNWVALGKLHARGVHVGQGKLFAFVLVVAIAVTGWRAMSRHPAASQLLAAAWIVLLAVALFELEHVSASTTLRGKHFGVGIGLLVSTVGALVGAVGSTVDAVRIGGGAAGSGPGRTGRALAVGVVALLVAGGAALSGHQNHAPALPLPAGHHAGAGLHGLFGKGGLTTAPGATTTTPPSGSTGGTGNTGNTGNTGSGPVSTGKGPVTTVVPRAVVATTVPTARTTSGATLGRHHRGHKGAGLGKGGGLHKHHGHHGSGTQPLSP